MNDQPAEAVEDTPPAAKPKPARARKSAARTEPKDSTPAETGTSGPEAGTAGPGETEKKPAPRRRPSKAKAASEEAAPAAGPQPEAPKGDAPEPSASGEAPAKPRAPRRRAKPAEAAPDSAPSEAAGEAADGNPGAPKRRRRKPAADASEAGGDGSGKSEPPAAQEDGKPEADESKPAPKRSRRRRGSSGQGADEPAEAAGAGDAEKSPAREESGKAAAEEAPAGGKEAAESGSGDAGSGRTTTRSRSRRRRSRRGGSSDQGRPNGAEPSEGDKEASGSNGAGGSSATVPAVTESKSDGRSGSGRGGRRRRSRRPRLEHIAPLGPRRMLVTTAKHKSQIAVLEGRELVEHYVAKKADESIVGNIYVGRVENVLPGMEAAFLDIGEARNAVLYVGEVSYDEDVDGPAPRIEKLLKSGQAVVAQVTKDPMGSKGARLTTEVSLAGRYLVLVPNTDSLGISRRLPDNERKRLRDIANRIRPDGHGLIVRTAANGASDDALERDVARLTRIWREVSEQIDGTRPPKLIYAEPPLAIRVVRDLFTADVEQVLVDTEESYDQIKDYLDEVAPDFGDRVQLYQDSLSLFERYHVLEQIRKAVDRKVWLASGGHIVIDRTEAMTVIDVNTGRFVGRSTLEDTVLHANLEAAEEIAKQLRLRDIGGIIVIDFIDMGYERNREELLRTFERALLRDKTRTQVYGVSELGLVQMTRKKVSEGLLEAFSDRCEKCEGRGVILNQIS